MPCRGGNWGGRSRRFNLRHCKVLVIYFEPPQTVYVDELPDVLRHGD